MPPPSFLLSILGERFELGEGLSRTAGENLEEAIHFVDRLCTQPNLGYWQEQLAEIATS